MDDKIVMRDESYKVVGAAMKVYNLLGCGFLEAVYQEALETFFKEEGIPYQREVKLNIYLGDRLMSKYYIADFICYDDMVIEVKATEYLTQQHGKQLLNYLKATHKKLGILMCFGGDQFVFKRILL